MQRTDFTKNITEQLNNLNDSQLYILFDLYQVLDTSFDFFMSEENHIKLINFYFDRLSIKTVDSIRSLLSLAIKEYTYQFRYIDLLNIFEMMKNNYSYNQILNNLISKYN